MTRPTDLRQQPGVCPECKGAGSMFEGSSGLDAKVCRICKGTGRQPAQPGSGEVVKPAQRYRIRHLIDGDNVLDWPRDLRKGPDVVIAADYDRLQSALNSARRCLREVRAAIAVDAKGWPIEFERGELPVIDLIDDELAKEE